jgi:hypothetical protein
MDRDDNRARGDRSLSPRVTFNPGSEPRGSSFGHVQLTDAPRVFEAKAVGTGVKFRHRIGGTAATDDRPHELREQGQMTWIEQEHGWVAASEEIVMAPSKEGFEERKRPGGV